MQKAFALSTPDMTKADLDTVSFTGTHPPAQPPWPEPHYPCAITPLGDQANDPQLRPRLEAMITWKVKGRNDEGTLLSSTGEYILQSLL